jgi:hypothetical protein
MHPTTAGEPLEQVVTTLSERLSSLLRTLGSWVQHEQPTLAALELHLVRLLKEFGATMLAGLGTLASSQPPPATVACTCGQPARFLRSRPAQVITLLGPITLHRPYYLCAACGHGQHPLDRHLEICAGSRSAALDELLALLGATQDSFAEAASVLERLTLLHLSPNSVRDATEQLGTLLHQQQTQQVLSAQAGDALPHVATPAPKRLYVTMDGVMALLHERGWSEVKVGCCYQTRTRHDPADPHHLKVCAERLSYITTLREAEHFGWQLWCEAVRRGVLEADEVVVLGDGAHWIWNIATELFPSALQIVDWYHASQYVWQAASAIWGESGEQREAWAHKQLDALWEGKVAEVLVVLEEAQQQGAAVEAALSYYRSHQGRMDYPSYRARGLQIGSGSAESACKQLISARLKGAGMIWDSAGAEAVASVRAWLKSERWEEALSLRPKPQRTYQRQQALECRDMVAEPAPKQQVAPPSRLSATVLAAVRTELAQERTRHPWKRAWSRQQQRRQFDNRPDTPIPIATA